MTTPGPEEPSPPQSAARSDDPAGTDPFDGADWKGPGDTTDNHRVEAGDGPPNHRRRRGISRRRLRRRRLVGLAMLVLGGLIVLVGAWVLVTGLLARSQLQSVRSEVRQLRSQIAAGDLAGARSTAHDLGAHAGRAHELTSGPAWAIAGGIPGGAPFATIRAITNQVDALGHDVLPALVRASTELDPTTLRLPDGRIDLARISAAAPSLDRATVRMSQASTTIAHQPAHTWLGPVDSARADLLTQLTSLGATLRSADLAAHIAPAMLGQGGVKRYFVGFQNEAEARGTGGLPGAFAILRADNGKVSFERFESDSTLGGVTPTGLEFGADYDSLYGGARTTSLYANSNVSPHYPYAAQIWIAMWKKYSGQRLDGAFAVDPTALSYLLQVTGPATLRDGSTVSAANVVALTQSTVYAKFPKLDEQVQRKNYLLALAKAASRQVLDSHASTTALVKAAGRAAGERRLLVYSTDPRVEADIRQTSLSGAISETEAPYIGMSVVNVSAGKLDYYLNRSLTWRRAGCGPVRDVTVTMRFTNTAPASGLSPYVTYRVDTHPYPVKPGDSRIVVSYFATRGATLSGVELDGKADGAATNTDRGHPVFRVDVELPRGRTRSVVLHLREPATSGKPVVLRQPLVRPLRVSVDDAHCG